MESEKILKIRPYARLLTMLGEQLIKNERIALIELIKNSYDADSDWVKVSFLNFGDSFEIKPESMIVIEDNGDGMNSGIIEKHWLNPATPVKKLKKIVDEKTPKGRVIQGEKGIGRYAILKLGRKIRIITRARNQDIENVIEYDFTKYDDEFLTDDGQERDLFIDDLEVKYQTRRPETIIESEIKLGLKKALRSPNGTRIEITGIKGSWSEKKVEAIVHDLSRFESIFYDLSNVLGNRIQNDTDFTNNKDNNFMFFIYKDETKLNYEEKYLEGLNYLFDERSVIKIEEGRYIEEKGEFSFKLNGVETILNINEPEIKGINVFKRHFFIKDENILDHRKTECGSFNFGFYIFDFSNKAPSKYQLDEKEKAIIRSHRTYLYRDGIRVYPYGEPDDDWLRIDMYRGTISAGHFLSNDQVVGYVSISQKNNPRLQDKTNREGLIEQGNATDDFLALLRVLLAYIRQKPYARYRDGLENKNAQDIFKTEQVQQNLDELKEAIKDNRQFSELLTKLERQYKTERKYLVQRAETTEELAGVGLSVETASHDIISIMSKATTSLDSIIKDTLYEGDIDISELQKELQSLRGMLAFIEAQLKDIQLLFKSSKQKRRQIKVKEILDKIERIYKRILQKEKIELSFSVIGSPLIAKTTDAVLLQLFLNLFDNSIYWLQFTTKKEKRIEITLDGYKGQLIFSDNGPGINKDDEPYIFEPFYSGKGEEGRGLGLYIARQLLERNNYSIELAELKSDKILAGANFVVSFVSEDN